MCEYCGYAPNQCYVRPTMTVEEYDGLGRHIMSMDDVEKVFEKNKMENDAEIILSKNMADAIHYVYFRVDTMETVEVYSTGFGAETSFTKYTSLIDMDEYLTFLLFRDHYTVIGGLWKSSASASLNVEEVL